VLNAFEVWEPDVIGYEKRLPVPIVIKKKTGLRPSAKNGCWRVKLAPSSAELRK
jgi:hypothetical protein